MKANERQVTHYPCPGCGLFLHAGTPHVCDWIEVAWFQAREDDVLITEIINLRSRCEQAEKRQFIAAKNWHTVAVERNKARDERDEAVARCEELKKDQGRADRLMLRCQELKASGKLLSRQNHGLKATLELHEAQREGVIITRCKELQADRDEALARCEELKEQCGGAMYLTESSGKAAFRFMKERDEAREWALKFGHENAKLHKFIELWKVDELLWSSERDDLRAKSRGMEGNRDFWRTIARQADAEVDDLHAQLASAKDETPELLEHIQIFAGMDAGRKAIELVNLNCRCEDLETERDEARDQLAGAEKDLRFQNSVKEVRAVSVADQIRDICNERDSARNVALAEAVETVRRVIWDTRAIISDKGILNYELTTALLSLRDAV